MARKALGVIAGLAVWMAVATVSGVVMRAAWPAYASVADAMTFTLPMMIARLSTGAVRRETRGDANPRAGLILLSARPTASR